MATAEKSIDDDHAQSSTGYERYFLPQHSASCPVSDHNRCHENTGKSYRGVPLSRLQKKQFSWEVMTHFCSHLSIPN
jgi:hypothetical protein